MISKKAETIHYRNTFLPSYFSIFLCAMTYLHNFKTMQKNVLIPRMDEKKLHTWEFQLKGISKTWDASCFKKGLLERQQCPKHLWHITIEKDIFSELNRCIFQISVKYIKLLFQKYSLYWSYAILIFTLKLNVAPPHHSHTHKITPNTKIKILDHPQQRLF